jgi:hypothetical protein
MRTQEPAPRDCGYGGWTRIPSRSSRAFRQIPAVGWFEAQARLVAYASDEVLDAFEATRQADLAVSGRYRQWLMLAEDNRLAVESGRPGTAHDGQTMIEARKAVGPALEEAEARDQALIKLIRDELRSKPEAAVTITEVPPSLQVLAS